MLYTEKEFKELLEGQNRSGDIKNIFVSASSHTHIRTWVRSGYSEMYEMLTGFNINQRLIITASVNKHEILLESIDVDE